MLTTETVGVMLTNLYATPDDPVVVYYCKSRLKDGCPVCAYQGKGKARVIYDATGVDFEQHYDESWGDLHFTASMDLKNSTTVAKASGARCVLIISMGKVIVKNAKRRGK